MAFATERSPELDEALGPGSPIVVFDKVSLAFDEKVILRDVSFTLLTGPHEDHPRAPAERGSRRSSS